MGLSLLDAQMLQQGMGSMAQAGRENQMRDLLGQATGMMGQPGGITTQQLMGMAQQAPDPARFINTLAPAQQMRAKEIMQGAGSRIAKMLDDGRLDENEFAQLEQEYGLNAQQIAELSIMVGKTIAKPKPSYMTLSKDEMLLQDGAPVMINPGAQADEPGGPVITLVGPKGKEVTVRRDSAAADKYMQMGFIERTTGRTINDAVPGVGTVPPGYQLVTGPDGQPQMIPIEGGPASTEQLARQEKRAADADQLKMVFAQTKSNTNRLLGQINEAMGGVNAFTTGIPGAVSGLVPGTPTYNLNQTLDTIKANLAFDRLQEMREASKTGGALGQVSERELALLERAMASLDRKQTKEQLRKNLERVQRSYQNWYKNFQKSAMSKGERLGVDKGFFNIYTDSKEQGQYPAVTTQQEYDALPSGAVYVENGQTYKKP